MTSQTVLATDLDGTLIPLDDHEANRHDLERLRGELRQLDICLVYVTGRHLELTQDAFSRHQLPPPDWLICDVGTSIFEPRADGELEFAEAYAEHLGELVGEFDVAALRELLDPVPGLRLQEPEKQTRFKLSYYCAADQVATVNQRVVVRLAAVEAPYRVISSVDPFTDDGLIDLLPRGVSKAYALQWWITHTDADPEAVIFAGDSGNDVAALTAGYRSIVVGNAAQGVKDEVRDAHQSAGWTNRLYLAEGSATSGLLEGLQHFLGQTGLHAAPAERADKSPQ